jgi:diacylglycerol kinase (ATP)
MEYDYKKQIKSFSYACKGIRQCVFKEQNLYFHLAIAVLVVTAGFSFGISHAEWLAVILCIGLVIAAELFNTAIEVLVNLVSPDPHPLAGAVKDIAAGAVLVCAATAVVIGLIVFMPYVVGLF